VELARRRVAAEWRERRPPQATTADALAEELLAAAGFTVLERGARRPELGLTVDLVVEGADGRRWCVDVSGSLAVPRAGLARTEEVWRVIGQASVLDGPVLVLTSHLPTANDRALRAAGLDPIGLTSPDAVERLRRYSAGMEPSRPAW
ncbi:MAG: hypothetical protein M3203_16455, partial [Actinomycetota bacterium]|nr:hypothetical protein [Actinomycetota bacterium]